VSQAAGAAPAPTVAGRLVGGLLVAAAALPVTLVECFLVPLRFGTIRVPLSIAVAVLLHPLLTVLMGEATRSRAAMFVPALTWGAVVYSFGSRRAEGDLILTGGNWVSVGLLVTGSLAYAITLGVRLPVGPAHEHRAKRGAERVDSRI